MSRLVLAAAALAVATSAQAAERSFLMSGYDQVEAAGPFDVTVAVGKGYSVRAVGAQKDLDRLKVRVEGRELRIGTEDRKWSEWAGSKMDEVKVFVTLPAIKGAAIAGSGDMRVDRVKAEAFSGSIAGSGDLSVGAIDAATAKFSVAGSGNITAAGRCRAATVSIAGSGNADIGGMKCETLTGNIAGSGNIQATATKTAKLSVMGSGDVRVAGGAKCDVSKMGSGSVVCG